MSYSITFVGIILNLQGPFVGIVSCYPMRITCIAMKSNRNPKKITLPAAPRGSKVVSAPPPQERPPLLFAIVYGALEARPHYGKLCLELRVGIVTKCWQYSVDGSIQTWDNLRPCDGASVSKAYRRGDGVGMGGHRAETILITYPEDEDVADVESFDQPLMSRDPTVVIMDRIAAAVDAIVQDECMILVPRSLFDAILESTIVPRR